MIQRDGQKEWKRVVHNTFCFSPLLLHGSIFFHQFAAIMVSRRGVFLSSEKVYKILDEILNDTESSFFFHTILVGSMIYQLVRLLLWKEQKKKKTVIIGKMQVCALCCYVYMGGHDK
jgi:hypothetical protein